MTFRISNRCFEISTVFAVILLCLYIAKRESTIPLSYSTAFDNWGGVMRLFTDATHAIQWPEFFAQLWCPTGIRSSPQCGCMIAYYNRTYWPDVVSRGLTLPTLPPDAAKQFASLGKNHSDGILGRCLRFRPSWRQDSCGDFCRLHLATPVLLASLYMSVLFSCVTHYSSRFLFWVKSMLPSILALLVVIFQLLLDRTGGIISSLSIVSVVVECYYLGPSPLWQAEVFWSYNRFFIASLAAWVAVTHQSRDVYLVASYAILGFFVGFLAYAVFLIKQGTPGHNSGATCLFLFLGIGSICGCFFILVQQHWYGNSPMWSSMVSPVVFMFALAQCLLQTPFSAVPLSLNLSVSLLLLFSAFLAVVVDLTYI